MEDRRIDIVSQVVVAYVANNSVAADDLPSLIAEVYTSFARITNGEVVAEAPAKPVPAVSIRRSVTPDYIVSLEDGKRYKALKRHLSANYGMTPDEYRAKWGLPADYPMVAPNYAKTRSELAKQMGLGQMRKRVGRPAKKVALR